MMCTKDTGFIMSNSNMHKTKYAFHNLQNTAGFDANLQKKYEAIEAKITMLNARQKQLLEEHSGDLSRVKKELFENADILKKLNQEVFALIPFDENKFEQYAKKLFQNTKSVILSDTHLTNDVINFAKLDIPAREVFGTRLYQKLAKKYGATNYQTLKFQFSTIQDGMAAGYDWKGTISTVVDPNNSYNLEYFLSSFIHEFSHYIYFKLPEKSPLTAQLVHMAVRNYIPGPLPTKEHFERYKNQPFERPSYKLMEYFSKHKFIDSLLIDMKIRTNQFIYD